MERLAIRQLQEWKNNNNRKPLLLQGARQVGKTWLMQEFGKQFYEKVAYFNFDNNSSLLSIFENGYQIQHILELLSVESGLKIDKNTLIIFDEIQECPKALTSLKYFSEQAPEYSIIAAGSLLGVSHHEGTGFPVGKIDIMKLYPLSFGEFLLALGENEIFNLIIKNDFEAIKIFKYRFEELLKSYCIVGGMPEVVNEFVVNKDYESVRKFQKKILDSYDKDFSKHIPTNTTERVRMLWNSIPKQLAKENKKFIYGVIRNGARASDYEIALQWLSDAGLIHVVNRVLKPNLPLKAYVDMTAFKVFILDVGLLSALSELPAKAILEKLKIFEEFNGALAEQFVLQQLITCNLDSSIYYWSNDTSRSEIDFLIQQNNIIPIEVKSSINLKAKSLKLFMEKFNSVIAVRTSLADFKQTENLLDIPLYAIENIKFILKNYC